MVPNTRATTDSSVTALETANRKVAYAAAAEGMVLLENDGALPIVPGNIALYGAGAAKTIKGGTGSGEVNERHSVTILEGLENAGFTVTTKAWIDDYAAEFQRADDAFGSDIKKKLRHFKLADIINIMETPFKYPFGRLITAQDIAASDTDICVYVVARQSGECADRLLSAHDYTLSDIEIANLKTVAAGYKKTILVINAGSSMDLRPLDDIPGVNAVLFLCQQGTEGGTAFADLLTGKITPSGRLTDSWANRYDDIPFGEEYSVLSGVTDHADLKEGIYVGYRYFDTFGVRPRYPFGYGLGYTTFRIDTQSVAVEKTCVTVQVTARNTGKTYSGRTVAQVYLRCPNGTLPREYQQLAAFAKTRELKPGETEALSLRFDLTDFAGYDAAAHAMILERGSYLVLAGSSSADTAAAAALDLDGDAVVSRHDAICPVTAPFEELSPPSNQEISIPAGTPHIAVKAADVVTQTFDYTTPPVCDAPDVAEKLNALTTDEMVELTVGAGMFGGNPFIRVPGASGNTTSALQKKGLPNIVLSDGPAGLRLQRTSVLNKRGALRMVDEQLGVYAYLPRLLKGLLFGKESQGPLYYQFTTAFPVGTALAQSWNPDLVEQVGRAVGDEMAAYGVTIWLAPGMNIHRNPLCGRNFEYFSEDPLLSGKIAAAVTRGVQRVDGCFVTLKHFAANNQETNRNRMSSNVGERALREIYLKGFKIAMQEGGARCVMTSYNKVNDVYTPNSYDLCTKVLRNEWGFDGLVMTDWLSTTRGMGDSAVALAVGNDLIMPGGNSSKKAIRAALKNGSLPVEDLRRCCGNILKIILLSQTQQQFDAAQKH